MPAAAALSVSVIRIQQNQLMKSGNPRPHEAVINPRSRRPKIGSEGFFCAP
jgi:hypothetical protein